MQTGVPGPGSEQRIKRLTDELYFPDRAKAEDTARQFESIFLKMIVKDLRKNAEAFGEGMFGGAAGSQIKEGWFDTMLAERLSSTGRVGLADALLKDWEHHNRIPPAIDPPTTHVESFGEHGVRTLLEPGVRTLPPQPGSTIETEK